jgi:hypothetical protein
MKTDNPWHPVAAYPKRWLAEMMNCIRKTYRMMGHYVIYVVFVGSCVALVASVLNHSPVIRGIAGQPIENTPLYHGVTIFVFAVMVVASGSGVFACIRRDVRHRRMSNLKRKEREAANNGIQPTK